MEKELLGLEWYTDDWSEPTKDIKLNENLTEGKHREVPFDSLAEQFVSEFNRLALDQTAKDFIGHGSIVPFDWVREQILEERVEIDLDHCDEDKLETKIEEIKEVVNRYRERGDYDCTVQFVEDDFGTVVMAIIDIEGFYDLPADKDCLLGGRKQYRRYHAERIKAEKEAALKAEQEVEEPVLATEALEDTVTEEPKEEDEAELEEIKDPETVGELKDTLEVFEDEAKVIVDPFEVDGKVLEADVDLIKTSEGDLAVQVTNVEEFKEEAEDLVSTDEGEIIEEAVEDEVKTETVIEEPAVEEEPVLKEETKETNIISILSILINKEFEAIQDYKGAVEALEINEADKALADLLHDIAEEEMIHVGELQKALELASPKLAEKAEEGKVEAEEKLEVEAEVTEDEVTE